MRSASLCRKPATLPRLHHVVDGDRVTIHALPGYSERAVSAFLEFVKSDSVFGLDVETSAIEDSAPFDPNMHTRLVQFGTRDVAWVLDPHSKWRRLIRKFLASAKKRFVSHNAAFDATRVFYEFGVDLGDRSIDTLPMADLRFPGRTAPVKMSKGLKELCVHFIDEGLLDAEHALYSHMADLYAGRTAKLPKSFVPGEGVCRRAKQRGKDRCENTSMAESLTGFCYEHWLERGIKLANSQPKTDDNAKSWGWNNIPLDDPRFLQYAGLDAIYVRRLLDVLGEELAIFKMNTISKREQRIKRYMTAVSVRGHRVDLDWTNSLVRDVGDEFNAAAEVIADATGGMPPASPKIKPWLEEQLGVRIQSLDKDSLPDLVTAYGDRGVPGEVIRAKQVTSNSTNLLTNLRIIQRHAQRFDGYSHAQINTQQAHTGRMSATKPAMQTFKKTDPRIRGCFIARDGHLFVGADYASQEIRIGAALSKDPALNKIVREGLNQHVLTAMSIFSNCAAAFALCPNGGCGECEACSKAKKAFPHEYAAAKILDFAQQYGAGPRKIALQLGVSLAEAKAMWLAWRHTYAGLVSWSELMASKTRVRNPFGRSIPADPWRSYANGNYMIQSSGRDVLGMALDRLADAGWADTFWLPVHDEMVLEVPEDRAEMAADALTEHMTTELYGVPIPATGEVLGTRWGSLAA